MNRTGDRRVLVVMALVAVGMVAGCSNGDSEESKPPEFGTPMITCKDVDGDDLDREVVRRVSVKVTDPDRDLTTQNGQLCGTLNGLPIALGDPDADRAFEWTPSKKLEDNPCDGDIDFGQNRLVCDGGFELRVTARDAAGNKTELDTTVQKGDSS